MSSVPWEPQIWYFFCKSIPRLQRWLWKTVLQRFPETEIMHWNGYKCFPQSLHFIIQNNPHKHIVRCYFPLQNIHHVQNAFFLLIKSHSLSAHCICILHNIFHFQIAEEAADRWLCNLQCTVSYCQKKFYVDQKTIYDYFRIDPHADLL